ncbi:MAG: hypothetical protein ABII12_00920 [Planctomycetota bacterium]
MSDTPASSGIASDSEPRWRVTFILILMLVGLYLAAGPLVRLSHWRIPDSNHALIEANAWRQGRLNLPATSADPLRSRQQDTAYRDGKVYNVFPPLFTFASYAAITLQAAQRALPEADQVGFYAPWYVALVAVPLPLLGFWGFRTVTGRSEWAAVLTAYWILGTPLFCTLANGPLGHVNTLNHALSNTGLMLIAADMLGKRRVWPAAIGFIIGVWTRQLTAFYLLAMVWIVWRLSAHRRRELVVLTAAAVLGLGTLASLNWAKFGSPFDSGYASLYEGRDDLYAQRYRKYDRLFDPRFIPRNLRHMSLGLFSVREAQGQLILEGEPDGTSLWLTCPLLLFAFRDARRWWRDPVRRALMLASLIVVLGFLSYHNTGSLQRGQFRFAMDVIPIWLMVIGPYVIDGRRRWITLACLGFSALYFHVLCLTNAV